MIYAELAGGLGNQMFIYAFARALGLRCGEPVTLLDRQDWRDGAPAHTVCALDALNISPDVENHCRRGLCQEATAAPERRQGADDQVRARRGLMAGDWHSFEAAAAPLPERRRPALCHRRLHPRPPTPRPRFPRVGVLPE